ASQCEKTQFEFGSCVTSPNVLNPTCGTVLPGAQKIESHMWDRTFQRVKRFRTRRRGKRAGALVKLRQRGFRTALPSIHLANLCSLSNKTDELLMLTRTNKDFSKSAALCFTETWLNDAIPDGALHLPGYQLFRADHDTESTGKSRGGGTCFYINERWCTDVTVLKMCCSDLEALFINCKPFYSPREFCSFILVSVYIPPQAHVNLALQQLADQIADTEQKHPDFVLSILGDFNKANLSREIPKYSHHVTSHIANVLWPSSGPHNPFSLGPSSAKNDGPEVAQNWINDKGHTWAITGPNLSQLITLNWP
ncbi:hypothetical protein M9458_026190, partial [Cirrhinus mrigala]